MVIPVFGTKETKYRIEIDSEAGVVYKTPTPIGSLGRWLLRREGLIYETLRDCPFVPTPIERTKSCLALEYISAPHLCTDNCSPSVLEQLEVFVNELHDRGIVHGDLNKNTNILVADSSPVILDFGTALCRRVDRMLRLPRALYDRLFEDFKEYDRFCLEWLRFMYGSRSKRPSFDLGLARIERIRSTLFGSHHNILSLAYRAKRTLFANDQFLQ